MGGNVYRLRLPSKSYFGKQEGEKLPFKAYASFLSGHGIPMSGVVTEARFDTGESVPMLKFRAVRPLTREEYDLSKAQGQSEDAKRAIETKFNAAPAQGTLPTPQAEETEEPAPVKRDTKKPEAAKPRDVDAVLAQWGSDDE
jgi:hypothetical protein